MRDKPRSLSRYIAIVLASILLAPSPLLHAQEQALADQENWSATQQEVWEQEQVYWQYLSAGEIDRFMTLWNEQFVGWPAGEGHPVGRSDIRNLAESVRTSPSYDLEPLAVNVYGDIGITFYRAIFTNREGEAVGASRLTHTWRKQAGEWTIIGGMSAPATDTASWKR